MNHPNDKKRPNTNRGSVGQFKRGRENLIHVAAHARMIDNPLAMLAAKEGKEFFGDKLIPWTQKPGMTFNVGRNAVKRIAAQQAAA